MSLHPEDLYRAYQLEHAETVRKHTLERQARAAHRPTRRLREIASHVVSSVRLRRWSRVLSSLTIRRSHRNATGMVPRDGALPPAAPTPVAVGSAAGAVADPAPESPGR